MNAEILQKYESYLRTEKSMADRSVRDYMIVAGELSKTFDLLAELSYRQINDVLRAMKEKNGWAQATVYKYAICVRHLFRWLQREEYRHNNPFPFSEWRKARPTTPKFLTTKQFDLLIDDPFLSHSELTLMWILWDSAARAGEVEKLNQQNIDLEKGLVNIPYEISKGQYSYRNVPITKKCVEICAEQFAFARRRGHDEAIFFNVQNERVTASGINKIIHNIGMRISPLRPQIRLYPHMFRHSAAIRWLEAGIPQLIVQKLLGHTTLEMTSRYVNLDTESNLRIFEAHGLTA